MKGLELTRKHWDYESSIINWDKRDKRIKESTFKCFNYDIYPKLNLKGIKEPNDLKSITFKMTKAESDE